MRWALSKKESYLSMLQVLQALNPSGDALVHVAEGEGAVPAFADSEPDRPKVPVFLL